MPVEILVLGPDDEAVLDSVAPEVFDRPIDPGLTREYLADPRHHLAVALAREAGTDATVVGMASGFHYIHPDKPAELYINEIGVTPACQRQGIGAKLLRALFEHGRGLGCAQAWLARERSNRPAVALFEAEGGVGSSIGTRHHEFALGRPRSEG